MTWYENTGAGWPRADGTWVRTGDVFRPTPEELASRGYKLRARPGYVRPDPFAAEEPPAPESFPEDLTGEEFVRLDHRRAVSVVESLPEGDPRAREFFRAERSRERGPRASVMDAFAGRGFDAGPDD